MLYFDSFSLFFLVHTVKYFSAQNTGPNVGSFWAIVFFSFSCFKLKIFDQNKGRPVFFQLVFLFFFLYFYGPLFFSFCL